MVVRTVTLGMTPRSSSAVLVTVSGPPESPQLLDRRRIELVRGDLPAQAYHAAAALDDLAQAQAFIEHWASAALDAASRSINDVLATVAEAHGVQAAGIVAEERHVPALPTVLRSHPLLHVAEGQLARETLTEAAQRAGLAVIYLPPKGPHDPVQSEAAAQLRRAVDAPWRKEHKLATVAALNAQHVH